MSKRRRKPGDPPDEFEFLKGVRGKSKPASSSGTVTGMGGSWVTFNATVSRADTEVARRAIEMMAGASIKGRTFESVVCDEIDAVMDPALLGKIAQAVVARRIKATKENAETLMHLLDLASTHLQMFLDTGSELEWESAGQVLQRVLKDLTIDKA